MTIKKLGVIALLLVFFFLAGVLTNIKLPAFGEQARPLALSAKDPFQEIVWGISDDEHIKATFIARQGDPPKVFYANIDKYIKERKLQPLEYSEIDETWRTENSDVPQYQIRSLFRYQSRTVTFETKAIKKAPTKQQEGLKNIEPIPTPQIHREPKGNISM